MEELRMFLLFVHLMSTLAMAAPLYMLVIVNERPRLGLPLNYNTDRFMENIIRKNAIRCFIFQGTMGASGVGLIVIGEPASYAITAVLVMAAKVGALAILVGLLSYIHFSVQPRIESLLDQMKPGSPIPVEIGPRLAALRLQRKRFSGVCLFLVATALVLGLRATFEFNIYLAILFIGVVALYAWRVYRTGAPWAWV